MKRTFTRNGYGRIIVNNSNFETVHEIILKMDEFEYEYLPENFITDWNSFLANPILIYTHKFDELDINELTIKCASNGVFIFCLDNGSYEFLSTS